VAVIKRFCLLHHFILPSPPHQPDRARTIPGCPDNASAPSLLAPPVLRLRAVCPLQ
jgi:hypothetical protein